MIKSRFLFYQWVSRVKKTSFFSSAGSVICPELFSLLNILKRNGSSCVHLNLILLFCHKRYISSPSAEQLWQHLYNFAQEMKYSTASALLHFKTQIRKYYEIGLRRLYRVPSGLSFQSSALCPPPLPQGSVVPLSLGPRGETHSIVGEGVEGPKSDEGRATLVLLYIILQYLYSIAYLSSTEFSKPNILDCWIHKPGT
jgi:hypothetical protein